MFNYDIVFDNMKDCVLVFDRKGKIEYSNPSAKALLGYENENIIDKKMMELIPFSEINDAFIQLFIDAVSEKHISHEAVVAFEKNDNTVRKLRVSITYTTDIIVVITDLTELEKIHNIFVRYTSKDVADKVLSSDNGLSMVCEQKNITVMMSDLRGFTAISSRLTPHELITMTNHYFGVMNEIILKHNGIVIEFLGDGIFILFGALKDNPHHALDAVSCAIEMQNAMFEVNEWNKTQGYPELLMGIGINSGECVVGNLGSLETTKFGALGENVNLAGRLESCTTGHQILISEYTKSQINVPLEIGNTFSLQPKGEAKSITVYEVTDILGENSLHLIKDTIELGSISPIEIHFKKMNGKAISPELYTGNIIKLSKTNAVLETSISNNTLDNLLLDVGTGLYAKITRKLSNEEYLLCFTSIPDSFDEWYERII